MKAVNRYKKIIAYSFLIYSYSKITLNTNTYVNKHNVSINVTCHIAIGVWLTNPQLTMMNTSSSSVF
jgi:hypothetical protein